MALGGGTWTSQNKGLPGAYINFVSKARASATLSERGVTAMPFILDWGPGNAVFTVTNEDFQKNSLKIFGYSYDADEMLPLRELFRYARVLYAWRLGADGVKATCTYATAKYWGTRGNDLRITISSNVDNIDKYDVCTFLGTVCVDKQVVSTAAELIDNDFVCFVLAATLVETAGTPLAGGSNGAAPDGAAHQSFLDKIEGYSFHTLGCPTDSQTIIGLYMAFTKRMRDEIGAKVQLIAWQPTSADYEGIIGIKNKVAAYKTGISGIGDFALVYWVTGVMAGCEVSKSNSNKKYDGELSVSTDYTQAELTAAIKAGELVFHSVGADVRILDDINTLVTLSDTKGAVFQSNQTVRVCDQIANDTAVLFNTRYFGNIPNDSAGRISLWNDICKLHQELASIRALENFDTKAVTVGPGATKKAVVCNITGINIINAMGQLYMSVVIE